MSCPLHVLWSDGKFAIVIGVNQYLNLSQLKSAVNDADQMQIFLKYHDYTVKTLLDSNSNIFRRPSKSSLNKVMQNIRNLTADVQPDKLIFYFSGHGLSIDGSNYLAFGNADIQDKSDIVSIDAVIIPWLRTINAKQTVMFIDACRESISLTKSIRIKGIKVVPRRNKRQNGIFIVYAASPGGYSLEQPEKPNGYFTEYLIKGLKKNVSKSLLDLANWLRKKIPEVTEKETGYAQVPFIGGDFDPDVDFRIIEKSVIKEEDTDEFLDPKFTDVSDKNYNFNNRKLLMVKSGSRIIVGLHQYDFSISGLRIYVDDIEFSNKKLYKEIEPLVSSLENYRFLSSFLGSILLIGGAITMVGGVDKGKANWSILGPGFGMFFGGPILGGIFFPKENSLRRVIRKHNSISEEKIRIEIGFHQDLENQKLIAIIQYRF